MKHPLSFVIAGAALLFAASANAITRQGLAQYAASLKGKKQAALKTALYDLMSDKTVLGYGSGANKTWWGFYVTDRNPQTNECYNRYSSNRFFFGNRGSSISGMNIEHSFPKSWWGGAENDGYKDLYNLYPSDSKANSTKSNYPMAVVTNASSEEPGFDKVGTGTVNGSTQRCWEPGDQYKGDFARTYLYMGVTYSDLTFKNTGLETMESNASGYPGMKAWATTLYRQWAGQDRVDSLEVARNNAVAGIQGNRNLFIDFPFLAEYVWGDSVDVAFDPTTAITTASDDDRYGNYTPTPDEPGDHPAWEGWLYVKLTAAQPTNGKRYLIVANNNGTLVAAKPVTLSSGKNYGYLYTDNVSSYNDTIDMADQTDAFTFESSGNGFLIKDSKGQYYYQDQSYQSFTPTANASEADIWLVSRNSDGTFSIKASDSGNTIMYSTNYRSWGNYGASGPSRGSGLMPALYEEAATATGIRNATAERPSNAVSGTYTLQGVRVADGQRLNRGIYIRDGRKFVVK